MRFGRRKPATARAERALIHVVESLEERRLLASTPLSYNNPVQTALTTTGAPVIAADVADLNGDSVPDVVALDGASGLGLAYTAQPFTGKTNGSFTGGNLVTAGGQTFAIGDFNGDSKLDLATPAGVLPGNGDGTFQAAVPGFTNPAGAVEYIAADFNNDSKLDLAVVTFSPSGSGANIGLDVLIGNGNGTFNTPIVTSIKSGTGLTQNAAQVFVDDFNGDGKLDVLTPFGLLLGNGDGTFKSVSQPLPVTPNVADPVFTAGDVNKDGKVDLLMVDTKSATGQAELLPGNGDGTFTDGGAVTIAGSGTITALTIVDLNADGFPEIAAGVQPVTGSSQIALLTNNGSGAFGTAQTFAVNGAPLEIFAGDMNGDSVPDIISIDSTPSVAFGAGTTFNASEVAVLLSKSTSSTGGSGSSGSGGSSSGSSGSTATGSSLRAPDILVGSSANPVVVGTSVTLTVTLHPIKGNVRPSGSVSFSINGSPIGTATLNKFGVATFKLRRLGLGTQPILVSYPGDTNFAPTSTTITELVLSSLAKTPLVTAALPSVKLNSAIVTGSAGHATIGFTNAGNARANGLVSVALYLTQDGRIDDNSIPLRLTTSAKVRVVLQRGDHQFANIGFVVPGAAIGTYQVIARVTAVSGIGETQLADTTVLYRQTYRDASNEFGIISSNHRITARLSDGSGHAATFWISGPGVATYTNTASGIDLVLNGTNSKSVLNVTGVRGFRIDHITVNGAIRNINAPAINLTNGLTINSGVHAIVLAGATGGEWAVRGSIGSIQITGALSGAQIFAGAYAGADGALGTSDDSFSAATIGSITVGGADTSSLVAAGVAPASGESILTKQVLLPNGKIGIVTVRGAITPDSKFIATNLPTTAILANHAVAVNGNIHFV